MHCVAQRRKSRSPLTTDEVFDGGILTRRSFPDYPATPCRQSGDQAQKQSCQVSGQNITLRVVQMPVQRERTNEADKKQKGRKWDSQSGQGHCLGDRAEANGSDDSQGRAWTHSHVHARKAAFVCARVSVCECACVSARVLM
eukprot:1492454-Pleurochrysis_carterae.AAC.1